MSTWLEKVKQKKLQEDKKKSRIWDLVMEDLKEKSMSRKMGINNKGEMFDPSEEQTAGTMAEEYDKLHSPADLDDDPINPAHYMSYYKDGIDCMTAMKHAFGNEAVVDFCLCNAFKYIWRHMSKNGKQDIEKAIWYLNKYLELNK